MGRHAASEPDDVVATSTQAIRVVGGSPTPEELAAVIAVLRQQSEAAASERQAANTDTDPRAGWNDSARGLRQPLPHGSGAWTRSLR